MPVKTLGVMALAVVSVGVSAQIPAAQIASRNAALIRSRYPAASIARGEEGVVGFRVALERTGRIRSCQVTQSSGFAALDTATCDVMVENAVFKPVVGADGRRATAEHDGRLIWTLPSGTTGRAVAITRAGTAAGSEQIVCKRRLKPDSNYVMTKTCLSKADWERALYYARIETSWYQGSGLIP